MKKISIFLAMVMILMSFTACQKIENGNVDSELKTEESDKKIETVKLKDVGFLKDFEPDTIKLPYEEEKIEPKVADYKIEDDLSNIENLEYFGDFTDAQRDSLVKNGFVICKTGSFPGWSDGREFTYDQIFQIYDANEYAFVPSFVTTDSMTHIFHIFYDGLLRDVEEKELYPKLKDMTSNFLKKSVDTYSKLDDEEIKQLALKNIAYFDVASALLGGDENSAIPEDAHKIALEELKKIENKSGDKNLITGQDLDYSQFTTRGHYTRNKTLENYFKAVMWYGQVNFSAFGRDKQPNRENIVQAFLITNDVYSDKEFFKLWSSLVDPMDFLVESADDLSVRDYGNIFYGVYGKDFDLNKLNDEELLNAAISEIEKLPDPLIAGFVGKSFRLIPQRKVLDNVLMQNLVDTNVPSKRPIYSGLDVAASFGNDLAKEIQLKDEYNKIWEEYPENLNENIKKVESQDDSFFMGNLYRGWIWMLQSYNNDFGKGYPMFMQNDAWKRKDISSALGSYAELKHDTILYGKAVMAEAGGGWDEDLPVGYVEPNIEFFNKLSWLLEYTEENLKKRDLLGDKESSLKQFREMLDFLKDIAKKELNNESLTEEEKEKLIYIGGWMEQVSINFVSGDPDMWGAIENETDRRMPIVADLMNVVNNVCDIPEGKYLEIASGAPDEIYVVYPYEDKLYLARGGVFSYYEFLADERLTDEKWQDTLLNGDVERPDWMKDLIHDEKSEVPGAFIPY